ncbi:MAG: response regulator [Spirochaetia bacterium]|nr:response regulator [Spirochaetia bacterium]
MSQPLRVLLIEKSATEAEILINMLLYAGFQIESRLVCAHEEIGHALSEGPHDLAICDCSPPLENILGAVQKVRNFSKTLPLIVVSEEVNAREAAELIRCGASDYVPKSNMARLALAVERERVKHSNDVSKVKTFRGSRRVPPADKTARSLHIRSPYRKKRASGV